MSGNQILLDFHYLFSKSTISLMLFQLGSFKQLCINYLKQISDSQSITILKFPENINPKLNIFRNNYNLFQDYCENPTKALYEKINSVLLSQLLHLKIVIYYISEDQYLNSIIINNNYNKTIKLLRIGQHYDIVYSIQQYEKLKICQTLAYELLNSVFNTKRQHLELSFKNIELVVKLKRYIYSRNTKVSSFSQIKPMEDFKNYSPGTINQCQKHLKQVCIKNPSMKPFMIYFVESINLRIQQLNKIHVYFSLLPNQNIAKISVATPKDDDDNKNNKNQGFFQNTKVGDLKKVENQLDQYPNTLAPKSPIYFINASPPGLTPSKYLMPKQQQPNLQSNQGQNTLQNQPHTTQSQLMNQTKDSQFNIFQDPEAMTQQLKQILLTDKPKQIPFQSENSTQEIIQEQNSLYAKRTGVSKIPMLKTSIGTTELPSTKPQLPFQQPYQQNDDKNVFSPSNQQQQYQQQQQQQYATQQKMRNYFQSSQQQQQQQQQQQNYQKGFQQTIGKKPPIILDEGKEREEGYLKFFDENKNYGFLVVDSDKSDIFVHFDDMQKIGVTKEFLKTAKSGTIIRFSFCCLAYMGKYNRSRKAVDLELLPCYEE